MSASAKRPSEANPKLVKQPETILLVEDESIVRRMLREVLEAEDYHVIEARDGQDALNQVSRLSSPVDLLLTDVSMPQLDGRTLAYHLRQTYPNLLVIYLSGMVDSGEVSSPRTLYVTKPIRLATLINKVRDLLARG